MNQPEGPESLHRCGMCGSCNSQPWWAPEKLRPMSPRSRSRVLRRVEENRLAFVAAREEAIASKAAAEAAASALQAFAASKPSTPAVSMDSFRLESRASELVSSSSGADSISEEKSSDVVSTSSVSTEVVAKVDHPLPKPYPDSAGSAQTELPIPVSGTETVVGVRMVMVSSVEQEPDAVPNMEHGPTPEMKQPGTSALLAIKPKSKVGFGTEDGSAAQSLDAALTDLKEMREAVLADFDSDIDSEASEHNSDSFHTAKSEEIAASPSSNLFHDAKIEKAVPSPPSNSLETPTAEVVESSAIICAEERNSAADTSSSEPEAIKLESESSETPKAENGESCTAAATEVTSSVLELTKLEPTNRSVVNKPPLNPMAHTSDEAEYEYVEARTDLQPVGASSKPSDVSSAIHRETSSVSASPEANLRMSPGETPELGAAKPKPRTEIVDSVSASGMESSKIANSTSLLPEPSTLPPAICDTDGVEEHAVVSLGSSPETNEPERSSPPIVSSESELPPVVAIDDAKEVELECEKCFKSASRVTELEMQVEALQCALKARDIQSLSKRSKGKNDKGDAQRLRDEVDSLRLTVDFLVR